MMQECYRLIVCNECVTVLLGKAVSFWYKRCGERAVADMIHCCRFIKERCVTVLLGKAVSFWYKCCGEPWQLI